jgi:hypothetical protein
MISLSNLWVTTQKIAIKGNGLPVGIRTRHGKYCPQLCISGKPTRLGKFETIEEAQIVYLKARIARDKKYIKQGLDAVNKLEIKLTRMLQCVKDAA